jgi:glycerol-3-phosphate dehydrogenase
MRFEAVVIGGGATGTCIARDLSRRGFLTALIEKSRISGGTTNASHHNLVGGMRYVLKDPEVAVECAAENLVIAKIAPSLVGKIKNYFVGFESEYTHKAIEAADHLGVHYREVDPSEAKKEIPELNTNIDVVYETEDRNLNVKGFCWGNCKLTLEYNGSIFENTTIRSIDKVGSIYQISIDDGRVIRAPCVINATGPWVNSVAKFVNIKLPLVYNMGTIIVQKTLSNRGLQYFHPPSNADAYIVHGEYAWIGTTSTTIGSPDVCQPESEPANDIKEKFSVVIPKVNHMETIGSFSGIRPLFTKGTESDARDISRDFKIIEEPQGFYHIVGGKLTTSRLMAEKICDMIAKESGSRASCRTKDEIMGLS